MKVSFLNPGGIGDVFFSSMASFMRVAAADFDIELETLDANRDPNRLRQLAGEVLSSGVTVDYLLLTNESNLAVEVIPRATERGVKVFLINEGLMAADRQAMGAPREKHAAWIGELLSDDHRAGHQLARTLIESAGAAELRATDGKIHVTALGGNFTISSLQRVSGLRRAVAEHDDVVLDEVTPGYWDENRAFHETSLVLEQNRQVKVIWAASDHMAEGAARAAEGAGLVPGQDVLVGGIDWIPSALDKIRRGIFTASLGGHFMDGAWALVLLHDYHHGQDFKHLRPSSKMTLATAENVEAYQSFMSGRSWQSIDFRHWSKIHNPDLLHYRFDLASVLAEIDQVTTSAVLA